MKKYTEFEQKSLDWHEIKWGKIGGSASAGLLKPTETLFIDILSQQKEDFEPENDYTSDAMERGNELEPFARQYLESYYGVKFEVPAWIQSEENRLLGISPDGLTNDNTTACEIKCFGRKKHWEILLKNEIPYENVPQLVHYFTVIPELKKLYFISFRTECEKHFIKELTRDTLVNIGTNAKPVMKSISEAVQIAKLNAKILLNRIEEHSFDNF
jgi:putative phage-type endonuclease